MLLKFPKSTSKSDRPEKLRCVSAILGVSTIATVLTACGMSGERIDSSDQPLPETYKMPESVPMTGRSIPLEDLNPRDTIIALLKRRKPSLDLSGLEHYSVKTTRKDVMLLQGEDGNFVRSLNLGGCHLDDTDIEPISEMKLSTLTLRDCSVKNLHAVQGMKTLTRLDLTGCPISSDGIRVISNLSNLKSLDLSRSKIKDSDLNALTRLSSLGHLDLSSCPSLTPSAVQAFKQQMQNCDVVSRLAVRDEKKDGIEVLRRVEASLMNQSEYEEADLSLQKLLSGWEKNPEGKYEYIARAYELRAKCYFKLDRSTEAMAMQKKAFDIYANHLHDNEAICKLGTNLAVELERDNRIKDGLALRMQSDEFWQRHPPTGSARGLYVENLATIAHDLLDLNRAADAKVWIKKALDASQKLDHPSLRAEASCLVYLAHMDYNEGRTDLALAGVTKALSLFDRDDAPNKFNDACYLQALCFAAKKKYAAAENSLRKAVTPKLSGERLERINKLLQEVRKAQGKTD